MRVKTETKRDGIVLAAADVFMESGYDGTLMSDVSERAQCSKGTLYSYFSSKEDLYFEVVIEMTALEAQAFVADMDKDTALTEASLVSCGHRLLQMLYSPRFLELRRLVFATSNNQKLGQAVYDRAVKPYMAQIGQFLLRAMDGGVVRSSDPGIAAAHFVGLLEAELLLKFILHTLDTVDADELEATARRAIAVFLSGYRVA